MKCIVMQVENDRAVLLDNKGNFITVKNNGYTVGQTIQYRNTSLQRIYATAASFVVALGLGVGGYKLYYTPVSYLSIEINPSIQLSINILDRVIGCEYFNDDGKIILDDVNIHNSRSKLSVEKIIDTAQSHGYLSEQNNSVIIDVLESKTVLADNLALLRNEYIPKNIDVVVERATNDDAKLSKDKNISIAKAKAVNEYSQVFGGSAEENSEALKKLSVKDVKEKNKSTKETVEIIPTEKPITADALVINVNKDDELNGNNRYNTAKPTLKPAVYPGIVGDSRGEETKRPIYESNFSKEIKKENKTDNTEKLPKIADETEITDKPEITDTPQATAEPLSEPQENTKSDIKEHFGSGLGNGLNADGKNDKPIGEKGTQNGKTEDKKISDDSVENKKDSLKQDKKELSSSAEESTGKKDNNKNVNSSSSDNSSEKANKNKNVSGNKPETADKNNSYESNPGDKQQSEKPITGSGFTDSKNEKNSRPAGEIGSAGALKPSANNSDASDKKQSGDRNSSDKQSSALSDRNGSLSDVRGESNSLSGGNKSVSDKGEVNADRSEGDSKKSSGMKERR